MTQESDRLEALAAEADTALEDGEYEIALGLFEDLLRQDPEHWGALLGRAECLHLLWRTDEALKAVRASLPRVIREAVLEVPVLAEPKPAREVAEHEPAINPEVLGLFVGTPVGQKLRGGTGYGDVVLLFQKNLERAGRSRQEVSKEMKITLLHEYGHYLGFDEEELEHLGLG